MKKGKRKLSALLTVCMLSSFAVAPVGVEAADTRYTAYLADYEQPTYQLGAFTGYTGDDIAGQQHGFL